MKSLTTPAHLSSETAQGRAWGSFFFTGFGTLWLLTGLANMHRWTTLRASLIGLVGVATLAAGIGLLRLAQRLPSYPPDPIEEARVRRVFNAVNIIQWVSVGTAVVVLVLLRMPEYIVPAIGIIVGLHLYPLAGAFRYPLHYVTGTVLVSWCTACVALLPKARMPGVGAFGTGAILLVSAAVTLALAYSRAGARERVPSGLAIGQKSADLRG